MGMVSDYKEVRLILIGVKYIQPEKGRRLIIDIGGGFTELVIGENFEFILINSRRMSYTYFGY
ncbi:hypothetical protein [Candidatus Steffania adelgidicola]|uniref:Ppx/GppA phosphatase family protein n=1 Tax=Candidatus Steffania adelgidicola TaxID=1076626 RepID=UPI001D006D1D|nr:hypothetical protein [Candidatus Steffania adelgidicola]